MIWAGIGLNARLGPMCFQNVVQGQDQGATAQRYIDQAITPHVVFSPNIKITFSSRIYVFFNVKN
jgi:hypothetical protein